MRSLKGRFAMPTIQLPDGSVKQFSKPVSVQAVAESIGTSLAKPALAGKIDDHLVDVSFIIDKDVSLRIITEKDPEGWRLSATPRLIF